jgi:hypothetical protein
MNPLRAIQVALTRRDIDEPPGAPWIPQETVTLPEILTAYTSAGAYASRREAEVGMLRAGMRADLAVLDRDLFEVKPERIHDIRIVATLVDGEVVFGDIDSP